MSTEEKNAITRCLDYVLIFAQLSECSRRKNQAVKDQDFKLALELRQIEIDLHMKLPSILELQDIRKSLSQ